MQTFTGGVTPFIGYNLKEKISGSSRRATQQIERLNAISLIGDESPLSLKKRCGSD
jgi:hypothetical protein